MLPRGRSILRIANGCSRPISGPTSRTGRMSTCEPGRNAEAPAKLYVTASPEVRAERRWRQLQAQGEPVTYDEILADIVKRDERDGSRADSPMRPAPDAVLLDTSQMTIEQAADAARRIVEAARARWEAS